MKTKTLWWTGFGLLLFTLHTNWASPVAAWLFAIPLLRYARLRDPKPGLLRLWAAFGLGSLVWLVATETVFVPAIVGVFALLATLQTLPFAADRLLAGRLPAFLSTLVFPAAVVTTEFAFRLVDFGDYGTLGFTQHANLPLLQLASVTGVHGISFLVAWFASVTLHLWERGGWSRVGTVYAAVLAVVLAGGVARMALLPPSGQTTRVAAVSQAPASVDASKRALTGLGVEYWRAAEVWRADHGAVRAAFAPVTDDLLERTRQEAAAGARLVVWPETEARVLAEDVPGLVARASQAAGDAYVQLAFALYTDAAPNVRNVALLVAPGGRVEWTYDKTNPTPMEPMTPGPGTVPVAATPFGSVATVICYDADFPGLMRQADAGLMLVPANDWYGFRHLHAERAAIRAVENGYSIVRPSSNGVTTAIDPHGTVLGRSDYFRTDRQTVVAELPTQRVDTVYDRVHDLFAWLAVATLAGLIGLAVFRPRALP
ncbi:apolipoprotein N-acyltransferase [Amycolatopsis suaedae]|uniref:Apolipoprotein acyltransferase n=1 Tax=Amycolatopsis suaedae TaxID=2510978 RepID=A0A4Q7J2K6_9PSEU|nr:nitrilase-related carbon-nitrogen hydrolase [Amycolatopsis suaedae]RZQ60786.1 apolipoprotein acyltransferase [Amycolatopsis suaedae]